MDIKKGAGKMKKMFCYCLILCFTVLGFSGCSKKESAETPGAQNAEKKTDTQTKK
jgi:hypothetical protein